MWLHVPVQHSSLVHHAHEEGFYLHHAIEGAERIGGEIVLSLWLDDSRPCKLPPFASHQVGVCGKCTYTSLTSFSNFCAGVVVKDDSQQVLVVQDKYKVKLNALCTILYCVLHSQQSGNFQVVCPNLGKTLVSRHITSIGNFTLSLSLYSTNC